LPKVLNECLLRLKVLLNKEELKTEKYEDSILVPVSVDDEEDALKFDSPVKSFKDDELESSLKISEGI
jgi:hypothetical protein